MIGMIIASFVLLFGFIGLGIFKFGLLPSYSAYASKWAERSLLPKRLNPWSIVTILAAFLLMPVMIDLGEGGMMQFLGFFAPLYLIIVGLTPGYETNPGARRVHIWGAAICAVCALIWMTAVMHRWAVVLAVAFIMWSISLATQTFKSSTIFWGEAVLFLSTYVISFLAYV